MKLIKPSFILILLFLTSVNANSQSNIQDSSDHSIQLFLVDDVSVAYMYNFSEDFSFRVSTDISGFFKDHNTEVREYENNSGEVSLLTILTNKASEQNFTLFTNFFYRFSLPKLVLYSGIGPFFGINLNFSEWTGEYISDDDYAIYGNSNTTKFFLAGGSIVLGIEIQLINNIMILAEYEATAGYHWSNEEDERTTRDGEIIPREREENFWEYKLNSLKVGLGIYL
jgi:hypothetical protein